MGGLVVLCCLFTQIGQCAWLQPIQLDFDGHPHTFPASTRLAYYPKPGNTLK